MIIPHQAKVVHVRQATRCRTCGQPIRKGQVALAWVTKSGEDYKDWRHEHDCKQCALVAYS